jgi:hypothetical protein
MKKFLIATTALTLMCGSAFAQNTGPAPQQDNMTKPGMTNNSTEKRGSMEKGTSVGAGTSTGMNSTGTATNKAPGDFTETGGVSNRASSGNATGQVAPGTSNAPVGNASTK